MQNENYSPPKKSFPRLSYMNANSPALVPGFSQRRDILTNKTRLGKRAKPTLKIPLAKARLFRALNVEVGYIAGQVLADGDVNSLVACAQGVGKVAELLAVVDNALAAELEGESTLVLAVWLHAEGRENGALRDLGVQVKGVVAGQEHHVVDVGGADVLAAEVGCEGGVALAILLV